MANKLPGDRRRCKNCGERKLTTDYVEDRWICTQCWNSRKLVRNRREQALAVRMAHVDIDLDDDDWEALVDAYGRGEYWAIDEAKRLEGE